MSEIVVAALYKFAPLENFKEMQGPVKEKAESLGIRGTLLLAHEGINGTIAGTRQNIDAILAHLKSYPLLANLEHKESFCDKMPFYRLKVRLKKEIVTLGVPGVDPNRVVGTYVDAKDWNKIIQDPEVIVLDTRNDYEFGVGTFEGAVDPQTKTFREFPKFVTQNLNPDKHKKVAMFCTGGIRCEKASAYMLEQGFEEVYHLKGGILKYLETVPAQESLWKGECFVFDNRVTVAHGLDVGHHDLCFGCRRPIQDEDRDSPLFENGVSCPACFHETDNAQKKRFAERQKQIDLAKSRHQQHIGRQG